MRRYVSAALGIVLSAGLPLVASVAPAAARTTGREAIEGTIVASGAAGARTVVSSMIVAGGVFKGIGRDVEVANRPSDPQNVVRDDLVFHVGTMHILGTNKPPKISANPQTCAITVRIKQTTKVQGGTGRFRHASGKFTGTVRGWGVAARNPDGTCSQQAALLLEVDVVSARGTLSF
jgi:hypothetical protein